jgi:hypothetical protein
MDGLRRSATANMNNLGEFLKSIAPDIEHCIDINQLNEYFNDAAQNVGMFNCIFDDENDTFNDLSGCIEVMRIGDDDEA